MGLSELYQIKLYQIMLQEYTQVYMVNNNPEEYEGIMELQPGEYGIEVCWRAYVDFFKLVPNE